MIRNLSIRHKGAVQISYLQSDRGVNVRHGARYGAPDARTVAYCRCTSSQSHMGFNGLPSRLGSLSKEWGIAVRNSRIVRSTLGVATTLAASISLAVLISLTAVSTMAEAAEMEQHMLVPSYRVGPYASYGPPIADAIIDYYNLLNDRDGGINGVKLVIRECETQYEVDRGIECYERYKNSGKNGYSGVLPMSAGIAIALYDRAVKEKIPIITPAYGNVGEREGDIYEYAFPLIASDLAQTTAIIRYIADREGGFENLKGKKIAIVEWDSLYGRQPFPVLEGLSEEYGFTWHDFPINASILVDQRATWLQIRRLKPDYVLLWGWGIMTTIALKEANATGFPLDRLIGNWWSAVKQDVIPVGDDAIGYVGVTFRLPGNKSGIHADLKSVLYDKGRGARDSWDDVGEILYNQGLMEALFLTEGMRIAMGKFGNRPLTGEETRWGLEHMNLSAARLKELGFEEIMAPINVTCEDHSGGGMLRFIQWDGQKWNIISDWISGEAEQFRHVSRDAAMAYAKEHGIEPRDCAAE